MTCPLCDELEAFRRKACAGKIGYGPRAAREVAEDRPGPFAAYRCPWCGHWHVGHVLGWPAVVRLALLLRHRQYPDHGDAA